MDRAAQLTIQAVAWSDAAADALAKALPYADVEELEAQAGNGAKLFEVTLNGNRVGFYMLRVDQTPNMSEGVILAAYGMAGGIDLTAVLVPMIERQFIGCQSMRIHTARPGLARKLAAMGWGAGEIILRKNL